MSDVSSLLALTQYHFVLEKYFARYTGQSVFGFDSSMNEVRRLATGLTC